MVLPGYRFQLEVLAEVEPVALSVSREEIDFRYSPDDWEPCITEQLTVHNPNNHTADYQWECSNPAFEVTPTRGAIEKLGSVPVTVTWRPGTGNNDGFLTLSVVGGAGASKRVRCSGTYRGLFEDKDSGSCYVVKNTERMDASET